MLIIKTEVKNSPIHGLGLFASEDLIKGQIIWVLHKNLDAILSADQWKSLIKPAQDFLTTYMYWSIRKKCYVACLDDARYMNHAEIPNTHNAFFASLADISLEILEKSAMNSEQWSLVDISEGFTIASRDIKKGEELIANYQIDFPDEGEANNQSFLP